MTDNVNEMAVVAVAAAAAADVFVDDIAAVDVDSDSSADGIAADNADAAFP